MGCGTATAAIVPSGLGRDKFSKSWRVKSATPTDPLNEKTVTIEFNKCEEEGIVDIGTLERSFPIHCNRNYQNI